MALEKKTASLKSILMDMLERIRGKNNEPGSDSIPTSDDINKRLLGDLGLSPAETERYLKMLVDSHHIFSFKIVEGNEKMKEKPIFGYVIAEHKIVSENIEKLKRTIESIYEKQNYKKKPTGEVIREVLAQGRHNNTPIGKAVNAALMLQQYESLLREKAEDYTEAWKIGELNDIINSEEREQSREPLKEKTEDSGEIPGDSAETQKGSAAEIEKEDITMEIDMGEFGEIGNDYPQSAPLERTPAAVAPPSGISLRAVDSPSAGELQNMDLTGEWGMAVQKFGVEFLLRIHFRKYEFDVVSGLVRSKKIAKESDLKYIRDTLRKLGERMSIDPRLEKYKGRIDELKRLTQMRLNEIFIASKGD